MLDCIMAGISFNEEDEQLIRNTEKEDYKVSTISYNSNLINKVTNIK